MEKIAKFNLIYHLKNFLAVTKPGIIMGNALTAIGGFALAATGDFDFRLWIAMLEGLAFIIASACVFNNIIDRELDKKMTRTRNRPLPRGVISPKVALIFALLLGAMGAFILGSYTDCLTLIVALTGLTVYVFIYSFSKYKTRYGTLIGSVAGAIPPIVGYTAVSERLDLGAMILFAMIALWQMPHFYAIAIFRLEDYRKGAIPVLPLKRGILATKVQMVFYCLAFMLASTLLALFDYAGPLYFAVMSLLGLMWLILSIQGLNCKSDRKWARKMFFFSLVIVTTFSTLTSLSL
ncbi:MAG: heme o synthase [Chlamydiota bacterium]